MVAQRCLRPAPALDEPQLRRAFEAAGVKEVHLAAVWHHVISTAGASSPQDAPGLPTTAREVLQRQFVAVTSRVQEVKTSADGSTTKLLIRLQVRLLTLERPTKKIADRGCCFGSQNAPSQQLACIVICACMVTMG